MKHLFWPFVVILSLLISSCFLFVPYKISNKKYLEIENGNFSTNVVIIDKSNKQHEFIIEPEWVYGWSEDLIGDFEFIHIKSGNDLEGIFIIQNNYKKKLLPFDVLSREEFDNKIIAEYDEGERIMSYDITIKIMDTEFEIIYDLSKFNVASFFSYQENYLMNKEIYMEEYSYKE